MYNTVTAPPVHIHHFSTHPKTCFDVDVFSCQSYLPFGFKPTLILESAIVYVDAYTSYNIPSDYSYFSSEITETIHIASAPNHFLYSVTLDIQGSVIFRLPARLHFISDLKRNLNPPRSRSLYTTFIVYLTTTGRQCFLHIV